MDLKLSLFEGSGYPKKAVDDINPALYLFRSLLNYGKYGTFLIMGNVGRISSPVAGY